jgi:uncharacterized membrane protein
MSTAGNEAAAGDLKLVVPGKSTPAGAGVEWISAGWKLFAKAPVMWIVAFLILIVIAVIAGFIPVIGQLIFQILNPVFAAGLVVACRSLESGGEFELEHVFAGFKRQFANLVIVGLLLLGLEIAVVLVCGGIVGFGLITGAMHGQHEDLVPLLAASGMSFLLAALVGLALIVPVMMLYWFAPALVVLNGMTPVAAMKASFGGCLRNIVPFLIYGIVMMILAIVASIPLGLGMLVWVPLAVTSTYASYRQIFTEG